ncbi:alpha-tubulin N-acetyltransferase-like [Littorina saxatilis]|uniref:Alpha-tubulin N-acetyltransferase n=1 Tax=Littorina saxatilis TaxID=31220 RepID=A0AAN9AW72_9CAEN
MEFNFSVNIILKDVITKVDSRLQVCRNAGARYQDARQRLFEIIDTMGDASAKAQGLPGAITTGRKLELSDHHLYVMTDPEGKEGLGAAVGILKIGRKRLFVYDRHGQQWEMNPLCILDFYVHESRQRMGCGRRLFDFMLKDENSCPQHLAVDRPSHKFASFLAKHYALRDEIPQVNNFVIFNGFFTKRPDSDFINNRRNANLGKPADYNANRGGTDVKQGFHNNYNIAHNYQRSNSTGNHGYWNTKVPAGLQTVAPQHQQETSLKDLNINPRSANNSHSSGNRMSPRGLSDIDLRSVSAGSGTNRAAGGASMQLQATMYSRHQLAPPKQPPPPQALHAAAQRPPSGKNRVVSCPPSGQKHPSGQKQAQQSTSGSRINATYREKSPPLLQREGPPRDYTDAFNLHQNYQGRAGHLAMPPDPRGGHSQPPANPAANKTGAGLPAVRDSNKPQPDSVRSVHSYGGGRGGGGVGGGGGGYYTNPGLLNTGDSSWTVFGVLRKQHQLSARTYCSSRLW